MKFLVAKSFYMLVLLTLLLASGKLIKAEEKIATIISTKVIIPQPAIRNLQSPFIFHPFLCYGVLAVFLDCLRHCHNIFRLAI